MKQKESGCRVVIAFDVFQSDANELELIFKEEKVCEVIYML